jgi:hypothetical protein
MFLELLKFLILTEFVIVVLSMIWMLWDLWRN